VPTDRHLRGSTADVPLIQVIDDDQVLASAGRCLQRQGWWHGPNSVDAELIDALRNELQELIEADRLHRAGIGRDLDFQLDREVRRDRIFWLDGTRPAQSAFLEQMEQLRLTLNRELFLGLFEFEGHFAHYPPGGFYRRHLDSFSGAANRIVSVVTYLNRDWHEGDGGELAIHAPDSSRIVTTIQPRAGTMVLFLSEEIPHEVLPAHTDRTSIAGWFRLNASTGNQIDPPR
jgi:SM-20-related protein